MVRFACSACALSVVLVCACVVGCGGGGGGASGNSNANLAALTVSDATLDPVFTSATTAYVTQVGFLLGTVRVTPTAADPGASLTVDGTPVASGQTSPGLPLAVGPTPVMIVVTASDGRTTKTYTVVVTRAAAATQEGYIKASNPGVIDRFGHCLALSGDTLVVGALGEDSNATGVDGDETNDLAPDAGAAYVFVRSGATWSQQAYLKASNAEANDRFGYSAGISGDTIAIGAYGEASSATGVDGDQADNAAVASGAVYVFVRSGTTWTQQAYLKAPNPEAADTFGFSVAVSGDTLVVGAQNEDSSATGIDGDGSDNSAVNSGAVYVFVRSGTTWTQQAYLKASNTGPGDYFGYDVGIAGDTLVVGAPLERSAATGVNGNEADDSAPTAGAAYVFVRSGTTWTQQAYLKASNCETGDGFGVAVSISGNTAAVGAIAEASNATGVNGDETDNSAPNAGAVYVFVRGGTTWTQEAYLKASNAEAGDHFGGHGITPRAVWVSGDGLLVCAAGEAGGATGVNGDESDNSAAGAGAAYLFVRDGTTWTQRAYLKASNTQAGDAFGWSAALDGDTVAIAAAGEASSAVGVNGDQADNGALGSGAVYAIR